MLVVCVCVYACMDVIIGGWHCSRVVGIEDPSRGCVFGKDVKWKIVEHSSEKKSTS